MAQIDHDLVSDPVSSQDEDATSIPIRGAPAVADRLGIQGSNLSVFTDPGNPLCLHACDSPGMLLVSKVFDANGFGAWKRSMIIALSAKNKIGFIDEILPVPTADSLLLRQWERCNDMVTSWIINALHKDIGESVLYAPSAQLIWKELIERFGQSNGAKLFQIQKDLCSVAQGTSDVASYFTRIKRLWDERASLESFPLCTYGATQALLKREQEEKLMQLLMGLNESYTVVRGNLLMMNPLPSIGQAYSLLIQEEKQREVHATSLLYTDSAALNSHLDAGSHHQVQRLGSDAKKPGITCDYCKKSGHVISKCYRLHGFPPGFKFTKPKKIAAQAQGSSYSSVVHSPTGSQSPATLIPGFTQEQCNKLLGLLSSSTGTEGVHPSSGSVAGPFNEEATGSW
ncbi:hypothetical protein Dimus_039382 [Dionaea muscipula]